MFFVLSKVLSFLLHPLNWLLGLMLWAVLIRRGEDRRRRRVLCAALVLTLLLTNPLLVNLAHRAWEPPMVHLNAIPADHPYDLGIVLGGFSSPSKLPRDRLHFNPSANRLTQALELYHQGRVNKLLISGGSAALVGDKTAEAGAVEAFLLRIGFPPEDLIVEDESRNTRENAARTAELLEGWDSERHGPPPRRILLFTDGFHMPRALACFEDAGITGIDPFPTSQVGDKIDFRKPSQWLLPSTGALADWHKLVHELAGCIAYKL